MFKYLINLILFVLPFVLYLLLEIYIDPFDILRNETRPALVLLKKHISYKMNNQLYKLQKFSIDPSEAIILGDSRAARLSSEYYSSLSGLKTANMAYGGGSLLEIIDTFWYIAKYDSLKQVVIALNLGLYNQEKNINRVPEAIEIKNSLISYVTSTYCIKSTALIGWSLLSSSKIQLNRPNLNRDEFWEYQLNVTANNDYRNYVYPKNMARELKAISNFCIDRDIDLVFLIPPTHVDLQAKIQYYNLIQEEIAFKNDLAYLGDVYDFDYPNSITENSLNYVDPYHFNDSIARNIIHELVTSDSGFARVTHFKRTDSAKIN